MSQNNFVSVEPGENGQWAVWIKDADTQMGYPESVHDTRAEAIEAGAEIDWTEYGLTIAPAPTTDNKKR